MTPGKCIRGSLDIVGSDQQLNAVDTWIHPTGIVGPDHGLNPHFVQDALGDMRIGR